MGNFISFSRNDIIFSGILIAVWIAIRPYFVRLGEKAQANAAANLEAEAAVHDSSSQGGASSAAGGARRKKLD
ncbi:hypothetical protein BGZ83_012065 [Gryganskiella cystojenkinii]|nr:hypothetical protein BGZ83_012065 [Gryganskiella cystojenkinii]